MEEPAMGKGRVLQGAGIACLIVAVSTLLLGGSSGPPWLSLILGTIGMVLLIVAVSRGARREAPGAAPPAPDALARRVRLTRSVAIGLAGLGAIALLVALVVAEGQARGHALIHLLTGAFSLALFVGLAFPWHPQTRRAASLQGFVLLLLAIATAAQFVESLGGSGYDAANAGRRIEALTTLHGVGVAFGGLVLVALPLGLITGAVVVIGSTARRLGVGRA
jgi:hypothetical protein